MQKLGAPEIYTQELADRICSEIASTSKSLRTICQPEDMPCVATVLKWLRTREDFLAQYTRAKEEQADLMVEEMIDISDDGSNDLMTIVKGDQTYEVENKEVTNRSKLRVETRKWIASKLKPKKYGEKLHTEISGSLTSQTIDLSKLSDQALKEILNAQSPDSSTGAGGTVQA